MKRKREQCSMTIVKRRRTLPIDIVRHLIPYTYKTQPRVLMEDIRDYVKKMGELERLEVQKPIHLILNSMWVISFMMYNSYYKPFEQLYLRPTAGKVKEYVARNYSSKAYRIQIRILLALFSVQERQMILL